MLTNRSVSSSAVAAEAATGRSLSYQGQPSHGYQGQQQASLQQRQMCLPLSPTSSSLSSSEDVRKIRQITKQNSFHEDQTRSYNGPQQLVDRRLSHAAQPTTPVYQLEKQNRAKMAATPPSRLPAAGGRVGAGGGGSSSSMSTSWTGEGHGGSDVPSAWRQFRNSDRPLRCGAGGGGQQQRLSSAKFASSIELSLDDDGAAKGVELHPTSTLIASPTMMGGAGRGGGGGGGGGGGVGRVEVGAETGRYFYQSSSPAGTQTDLGRMFESPPRAPPYHAARSGEGQRTLAMNGAHHVLPPGLLETSTAGSYPELHNIALHESRRGSLPAPRKLDETSSTPLVVWTRREGFYENNPSLTDNRHRNEPNLFRSNGDGNHLQNGNGKTPTTFLHDVSGFKSSSDGINFLNACSDGKRFWSARNGSTAVSGQSRYVVDGTTRENIYEEIDGCSSLRSTTTNGNSAKQPLVPQPPLPTPTTATTDVVQSGGYRGPIMSLRLTPADQLTLLQHSISSPLSSRHRLFSSTRSIHQSFDDVFSQDYPTNPRNRAHPPPVRSTVSAHPSGSAVHTNSDSRCHPRPYSRNPDDTDVGTARVPDRVPPRGAQTPLPLGVTTDGYLEPVTLTQPLDVTVARLEALLQEKDGERKRLQAAMEDKECCLIKQLRLEKRNSELRLVELADEWNRRLACHQQKAFRIEQSLLSQIYKLRTEKKSIKEQLDRLRLENEALASRVGRLENDLQTSRTSETRLQSLNDETANELESLKVQLMDATVTLLSSAATNGDLNNDPMSNLVSSSAEDQTDEYGRIQSANDKSEEREGEEEEDRLQKNNNNNAEIRQEEAKDPTAEEERYATCRPNTASGSGDDDVIRRLERELEETRDRLSDAEERMRTDQEQWMDEKKKVIAYQKQLQLNYIQIVQRNKMLQQETHQLALELERQHIIRQADAVDSPPPSTAPLANAGETTTCGAELTLEARSSIVH